MSVKAIQAPTERYLKASKSQVNNEVVSCIISRRSTSDAPSPLEFDKFMPWVCLQFEVNVEVTVIKSVLERHGQRRRLSSYSSRLKTAEGKSVSQLVMTPELSVKNKKAPSGDDKSNASLVCKVPITAFYDTSGHLAEIAILKSPYMIHRKIIKCINICLPFHPALFKLSIRSGLTSSVLYDVAKMLPHSNITEVCFDDCFIPEGNYFILLDYETPLKFLSLKRCQVNDMICKEISKRIDFGGTGVRLTALDLSSNEITDRGVWYLANVLRRNRHLLHLNLSSNKITDCGLMYIMDHLKEFPMNREEVLGRKKRRYEFIHKFGVSQLEKRQDNTSDDVVIQGTQVNFRYAKGKQKPLKKKKQSTLELTNVSAVEMFKEDFKDVFDDNNIVIRDGVMNCIGNLTLCSLNLAYNELDYFSVKRILEVLHYQRKISKTVPATGLLRLILEGNLIPQECGEIRAIRLLLNPTMSVGVQSQRSFRSKSTLIRK